MNILVRARCSAIQRISQHYGLTRRESEILMQIAVIGSSNQEIADRFVISEKTVKNHVSNLMNKMGARSMRKLMSLLFSELLCPFDHLNEETVLMESFKLHVPISTNGKADH